MFNLEDHTLFQNEDIIVINKPSGLLSIPDRAGKDVSLKQVLKERLGEIFTVHRLDRDTSGVIVFAKNEGAHKFLSQQFENRETSKVYSGLVLGIPAAPDGVINEPIAEHPTKKGQMTVYQKGKESITEYEVLEKFRLFSWLRFNILTGRTHQIRVHMKFLGNPIACDDLYGDGKPVFLSQIKRNFRLGQSFEEERPLLNRLALHAASLSFTGVNNEPFAFEAPLPRDLKATLNQLNKNTR
jgi:23S rRNA pseudouridine1911/1915/1917 synthase